MLQINELIFKWPNSIQQEVNLEASAGKIVLIGGPSGIGKTTLFNIISGFYETVSGSVIFNGKNLISKPPWKRPVSTMFQSDNLFPHLSVKQNLMLGIKNFSKDIENQLYFLKIFSLINQKCSELSGGELQRVALIKTLSREKPIILLDEPFSALDEDMIEKASILIQEYTKSITDIIQNLFLMFVKGDCDLVEVNPLAITDAGVMALDSKVALDMNAKYKHSYFEDFEKEIPIPESEKNAKEKGLNFIKLDGSVGIIGNGAGLVMSTLDVVAENGGNAANFLDIGGGARAETVSAALEVLEADKNVKSVLINIFGGITRCDLVAAGIVEATKGKDLVWPIVIRLDGTNSSEGLEILKNNPNEKIFIEESMDSAARLAVERGA